ncbi:MAG: hypothetical protein H7A51_04485 [Akkermansiaceae bacterium]|nr:hypothetical protein [Akkermansiaceae bacterium]
MIAIGQLQKSAGPDQRVTANASIFDEFPDTLEIDGVALPHTVGSWSTVTSDRNPIIYQKPNGAHADRRNPTDPEFMDHRENVFSWLISGSEDKSFDPRTIQLTAGKDAVVIGFKDGAGILAPLVASNSQGAGTSKGGYAYHVSDLGVMAPIIQHNKHVTELPSVDNPQNGGYGNLYTGTKRPYGNLTETQQALAEISEDVIIENEGLDSRYLSYGTASINPDGSTNGDARKFLHDNDQEFTRSNKALIVNTLTGGFKTDLTPYFRSTSEAGEGSLVGSKGTILKDSDPLLTHERFVQFSPKFGALRDYMQLGRLAGSNRSMAPRTAKYGGGASNDYPDPTMVVKHGVHPVIAEYSVFARPVIDPSSPSNVSLLIYPRVTLWNPYNVTLDTTGYFVQINQRSYMKIQVDDDNNGDGSNDEYAYTSPYWGSALPNDGARSRPSYMFFYLDPVAMEPGQSLVFTPANTQTQKLQLRDGNIQSNRLSASADISDLNCFYVNMSGPAADTANSLQYKFLRYWENGYHIGYEESTSARLRIANGSTNYAGVIAGSEENPNFPIVHTLDIHNWIRGNEGRWHDINRPWLPVLKINTANTVPPDNRTKLGIRLKAFNETAENMTNVPQGFWHYPLLEMANMRSPFYRRTPWDWIFANPTVLHEYSFGPFASDDQEQPGYLDPFTLPRYVRGVSETSPFMDSSSSSTLRYVLFDVPLPNMETFSLAQLRQASLTHEFSAPSYIIGESLVPVTAPRDSSALSVNEYTTHWWQGLKQSRVPQYATWWQDEYDPSNHYSAYDYRFETNHALWDQYFFSTIPENGLLSSYRERGSLPNPRMEVANDPGLDLSTPSLSKADNIARFLRMHNHHSVNSTSAIAWKSLLSMNMGMDIASGNTGEKAVPFPGSSQPTGDGLTSTTSLDSELWSGYRQLTSSEIDLLAKEIVAQVKRRAPFISLSDFVNRRLMTADIDEKAAPDVSGQSEKDLLSYAGALEVAVRKSALNAGLQDFQVTSASSYVAPAFTAERINTANAPTERFANAPAHLTQGKILESIGANLTARSDSFRIRAYGEAQDAKGNVTARAYCEAIVQRTSEYVDARADDATTRYDDLTSAVNKEHGRRFVIESFRWLANDEMDRIN